MGFSKIGDFSGYLGGIGAIQAFHKPVDFYDKVTFHGATRQIIIEDGTIKGFTVSGEVVSENWDGTIPVSLPDAGATVGYALDPNNGTAQFMGTVTIGGNLLVEDGTIYSNATTGHHLRIGGAATGPTYLDWYNNTTERAFIAVGVGTHGTITMNAAIDSSPGATQAVYEIAAGTAWGNGSAHLYVSLENKSSVSRWYGPDGAEATPGYAFTNDPDTGFYRVTTNNIAVSAAGSRVTDWTSQGTRTIAGSQSAPSFTFITDNDTGFYSYTTNQIGVSAGNTLAAVFKQSATSLAAGLLGSNYHGATSVLGGTAGNRVYVETAGGSVNGNNVYLDTLMIRNVTGSGWGNEAIGIRRRTDATEQASIWFDAGVIGINDSQPSAASGALVVNGSVSHNPSTTGSAANAVYVATTAPYYRLWRSTSSRRYKEQIDYDVDYLADLTLRPNIHWRTDDLRYRFGFIAEDLVAEHPYFAVLSEDGEVENYDRDVLLAVLTAKVNRLEQALKDCHECGRIDTRDQEQS